MPNYFDPRHRLDRYLNGMKNQSSSADLLDVLRQTRLVIESKHLKTAYPTLSFYCDWYVHGGLDRNPRVWEILTSINTAICDSSQNPVAQIAALLKLDELRAEAIRLFNGENLNPFLFSLDENWSTYIFALLRDLSEKRLRWPDDLSKNKHAKEYLTKWSQAIHWGGRVASPAHFS